MVSAIRLNSFLMLLIMQIYLLLSTYAPGREYIYSNEAFALLFFVVCTQLLVVVWVGGKIRSDFSFGLIALYFFALSFVVNSLLFQLSNADAVMLKGALNRFLYMSLIVVFVAAQFLYIRNIQHVAHGFARMFLLFSVLALIGAIQMFFTDSVLFGALSAPATWDNYSRLYGWFSSPNTLVDALVVGFFSAQFLLGVQGSKSYLYLLLAVLFAGVLLTGSKGGILAFVLSVGAGHFLYKIWRREKTRSSFSIRNFHGMIGVCLVFVVFMINLRIMGYDLSYFVDEIFRVDTLESGSGRSDLWLVGLYMIMEFDAFEFFWGYGNGYISQVTGGSMHNGHLNLIIEGGVGGYIAILAVYALVIYKVKPIFRAGFNSLAIYITQLAVFSFFRPLTNGLLVTPSIIGLGLVLAIFVVANFPKGYLVSYR